MAFGFIKKIFSFGKKKVEEVPAEAETEAPALPEPEKPSTPEAQPPADSSSPPRGEVGKAIAEPGEGAEPAKAKAQPEPKLTPTSPSMGEVAERGDAGGGETKSPPPPTPDLRSDPPHKGEGEPEPKLEPVEAKVQPSPKPSPASPSGPSDPLLPGGEKKPAAKPKAKAAKPKAPTPAPTKGEDEAPAISDDVTPEDAAALEAAEPWVEPEDDIASSIDARLDEIEQDLAELPEPEAAPAKDSSSLSRGDVGETAVEPGEGAEPTKAKAQSEPDPAPTPLPGEQVAEPSDARGGETKAPLPPTPNLRSDPPHQGEGEKPAKVTVSKSVERAAEAAPAVEPEQPKKSWLQRLRSGLSRSSKELSSSISGVFTKRKLDEDTLQDLEDILIRADLGAETAMRIADTLSASRYGRDVSDAEVRGVMASEIEKVLSPVAQALELDLSHKPHVILVVGVNGTGKTTTIGKLAAKLVGGGLSVTLAAGDTFRAAAIEQLKIWGERTGSPVVSSKLGADAAGLAWDAFEQAKEAGSDVLIIDTAGRLQNRTELMDELEKIVRVLGKHDPEAPHTVLQTVDATTGQNALNQVEIFRNVAGVNGLVMTKLDGTARGGILVAIAAKHKLPVYFIGVGEQVDDLEPFSAHDFAAAIAGTETA
ncbi:MAG: signal recognition particle-docking protein FtsY [Brucellaceae bacterium]|nr:signal recognition particle-docking protein FtsY [Brucellaceae bacterium]